MVPLWKTLPWENPRLFRRYPMPELNAFRLLLFDNDRFLAKLDLLPKLSATATPIRPISRPAV